VADPSEVARKCRTGELQMHERVFKQWFKTRAGQNAHSHYYNTGAEVKSDNIIDDMFHKLDNDGGGTLDIKEI
jgi:hypothetical protein